MCSYLGINPMLARMGEEKYGMDASVAKMFGAVGSGVIAAT